MKKIFIILFVTLTSCKSYKSIDPNEISHIYILFKDTTKINSQGYKLQNGEIISWDRKNNDVKSALKKYSSSMKNLEVKESHYLTDYITNKRTIKYLPIKVIALSEFGYIETNSKISFYGIMDKIFIDLSENKTYVKKDKSSH